MKVFLDNVPTISDPWVACEHPERPAGSGVRFHLRSSDNCRPCAIAWFAALANSVPDPGEATDILTDRARRILAGATT